MEQENKIQSPGYRELFKEIKNQLSERSGITLKRSLLIGWPALIVIGIISYIGRRLCEVAGGKFISRQAFSISVSCAMSRAKRVAERN